VTEELVSARIAVQRGGEDAQGGSEMVQPSETRTKRCDARLIERGFELLLARSSERMKRRFW
jgi:hypothetical protein